MLEAAGFKNVNTYDNPNNIGLGIHEMGTARMGRDAKTSVLNGWNQVRSSQRVCDRWRLHDVFRVPESIIDLYGPSQPGPPIMPWKTRNPKHQLITDTHESPRSLTAHCSRFGYAVTGPASQESRAGASSTPELTYQPDFFTEAEAPSRESDGRNSIAPYRHS